MDRRHPGQRCPLPAEEKVAPSNRIFLMVSPSAGAAPGWGSHDSRIQPDMPKHDDTPETLIAAGRRFRAAGELDAAVDVLTRAHQLDPTAARPLVERGAIAILQHHYEETLADYTRAEQLDPHYPGLASYFAELYFYTGRPADALRISTDAAGQEPGNLMHRINIAHAQLLLGNTDARTECLS